MSRFPITAAILLALGWAAPAAAQTPAPRTVHLAQPTCGELPVSPRRVRELLALALELEGAVLVEDPALAEAEVSYEPYPCGPAATRFVFHLSRGGVLRMHDAAIGALPLGSLVHALALEMANALRGQPGDDLAERIASFPPPPPPPAIPPPEQAEVTLESPRPPRRALSTHPATRVGIGGVVLNAPAGGATLGGAFAFLDLPLGRSPLVLRMDAGGAIGPSAYDLVLASITGGLTLSYWARVFDRLAVRAGPRLWLGYGWALHPAGASRQSDLPQVGAGGTVAAEIELTDALVLVVEGEVGANLVGLGYALAMGHAGFRGAYWGGRLGLAWRL